MTYSKMQRLIICDVREYMTDQDSLKDFIKDRLYDVRISVFYDKTRHISLFVDYCPETKQLEVTGHLIDLGKKVSENTVSFTKQIMPSPYSTPAYIVNWINKVDADYLTPKPESYNVF